MAQGPPAPRPHPPLSSRPGIGGGWNPCRPPAGPISKSGGLPGLKKIQEMESWGGGSPEAGRSPIFGLSRRPGPEEGEPAATGAAGRRLTGRLVVPGVYRMRYRVSDVRGASAEVVVRWAVLEPRQPTAAWRRWQATCCRR